MKSNFQGKKKVKLEIKFFDSVNYFSFLLYAYES